MARKKGLYEKTPEKSEDERLRDAWLSILKKEEKANGKKRERAQKVVDVYADDRSESDTSSRFNILWSNTQVLHGALYSRTPKPDIRRRFLDKDPISREVATVLERSASFSIDSYDFDGTADVAIMDHLTAGYGQIRVRYKPYFDKGKKVPVTAEEDGTFLFGGEKIEPEIIDGQAMYAPDELVYQELSCEPVEWKKFRWDHLAKRWEDVNWCCIDHYMTKSELVENFGKIGKEVGLTHCDGEKSKSEADNTHALVHEIFDKKKRQIVMVSEGYKTGPIQVIDDELNLVDFYPFPKPLFASQTGGLFPKPDYLFYQDQSEELNRVTGRIDALVEALKVRGVYDSSFKEMANVLSSGDNDLTAVKDFAQRFNGKDLHSVIAFMPLEELAKVVAGLYQQRDQIKQTIYEITGISDIIRGSTDPNETLGAQELKGRFADMRLSRRRNRVNAFLRDIIRIKSEIIAEHFEPVTLQLMTGIDVNDQMLQIMRSDVLRSYKIDIESESTVAVDAAEEQKNRLDALGALTGFLEKAIPAVQGGFLQPEMAKELALFGIRGFKHSRQLEDVIERLGSQENDPSQLKSQLQQAQQQIQQLQQQLQQGSAMLQEVQKKAEGKEMEISAKAQSDSARLDAEDRRHAIDIQNDREKFAAEMQFKYEQEKRNAASVDREFEHKRQVDGLSAGGETLNTFAQALASITEMLSGTTQVLSEIVEKIRAPKPVVYDKDGRIVSVGDRQVIRGADGKVELLN